MIGLIQLIWLRHTGVATVSGGRIELNYTTYLRAARELMGELLSLQERGARADAAAFIERWTAWDEGNEAIARAVGSLGRRCFFFGESKLEPTRGAD